MTTKEKIEAILPLLESANEDIGKYRKEMEEPDKSNNGATVDFWYDHFAKLLAGEALINKRVKKLIPTIKPVVEKGYIDTLAENVAKEITIQQWEDICAESIDPAIKRTSKRLYDGRNIKKSGMIKTQQEFKAYYNIKGNSNWIEFESAPQKFFYHRSIKERSVELAWDDGGFLNMKEKLKFPFTPEEYEEFVKDIESIIRAIKQ